MRAKVLGSLVGLVLILVIAAGLALSSGKGPSSGIGPRWKNSPNSGQRKPKKLKEIALERDVEVQGSSRCDLSEVSLSDLTSSKAIVYGRITESKSFFEDSGAPIERGEYVTTEYLIEVLETLKDRTLETLPASDKTPPSPLTTPVKIARNGGTVYVNGHRASVKVKGYEELIPERKYVFFLNWSADYRAYVLTACIFGAVMVNDDLSLKPLGSSKRFETELRGASLLTFREQIKNW